MAPAAAGSTISSQAGVTFAFMGHAADTGRRLEQQMAAFFRANGYEARCNEVLEGRSGGRHEVDVLAVRTDAVTTYRVAVECKAWQQPIEKDVISKLHYVMGDLGLHKGIVVSLTGWRSGAERAADELGIELWGPAELRRHLGDDLVAGLAGPMSAGGGGSGPVTDAGVSVGPGVAFASGPGPARRQVRWAGMGRLQLRTLERVVWFEPVWVPGWSVQLTVAAEGDGHRRFRPKARSTTFENLYDGIDGAFLGDSPGWTEIEVDPARCLRPTLRDTTLHTRMRRAVDDLQRVTTAPAIERHQLQLVNLGVPVDTTGISIDATTAVHLPFHVGILDRGGEQRVVAVAGDTGQISAPVSHVLTMNLAALRARFDI
jgi:hypothetical protein